MSAPQSTRRGTGPIFLPILAMICFCMMPIATEAQTPARSKPKCNDIHPGEAHYEADCREDVDVSVFTGFALDTFAAADLKKYLNPQASGDVQEQLIAGFDFAWRLTEKGPKDKKKASKWHPQVWLYGETVHGVRSGDVDCEKNENAEVCRTLDFKAPTDSNSVVPAIAIFRKSTSFEGFFGLRAELLQFHRDSEIAASRLYVKGQLGFLTVANNGGDVVDMHHVGVGVIMSRGPFQNSYVEIGYGKNDIFSDGVKRYKFDALLSMNTGKAISPFAQIVVDADLGNRPDSIRSFFGFDIDVRELFKPPATSAAAAVK